jgi:hypothetical protein
MNRALHRGLFLLTVIGLCVHLPLANAEKDRNEQSNRVMFGLTGNPEHCKQVEAREGCRFNSLQVWIPLSREDGKPVFTREMRERIEDLDQDCIVVVKIEPCIIMKDGAKKYIDCRHFNPEHCSGDKDIDSAVRRLAREFRKLGRRVCFSFAPDANVPNSKYFANGTASDYVMATRHVVDVFRDEDCDAQSMWSIHITQPGCLTASTLYPGHEYVDILGGTVFYHPDWYGWWGPSYAELLEDMCDELKKIGRWKPIILETGIAHGRWSRQCLEDLAAVCQVNSRIAAVNCYNVCDQCDEEDNDSRKKCCHDGSWRMDDAYFETADWSFGKWLESFHYH